MFSTSFDLGVCAIRAAAGYPRAAVTLRVSLARAKGDLFYSSTSGQGGGNGQPPCLFMN